MGIQQRYQRTLREVQEQCVAVGRDPHEVCLVAVSKTVGVDGVADAIEAGASQFGENRPDQILEKSAQFPQATWHFIGNIQSRRIRDIVSSASLIHSLYRLDHAEKINKAAEELDKIQDVLIEVNVSGEESKSGVSPAEAKDLICACAQLPHVRVRGVMTMAPQGDLAVAHSCFVELAQLCKQWQKDLENSVSLQAAQDFNEISMGMSEDWREAIAAGATIVRIGRAIFSDDFE